MKDKREKIVEFLAILVVVLCIIGSILFPLSYESESVKRYFQKGNRVITITGVFEEGVWTDEEVRGGNYWYRKYSPARPVLQVGQEIILRLKSADVIHAFYSPGLGIGPVDVYPGQVVEIKVIPEKVGIFEYYCTTMCGGPHFGMRGEIVVLGRDTQSNQSLPSKSLNFGKYWLEKPPPPDARPVEYGKWLYRQKGCFTCHGLNGEGGIQNWNYVKNVIPALNILSERMMLFDKEDADEIVKLLERGIDLEKISELPVPRYNVVLAQYKAIRDVIKKGSLPGKKDPEGPMPPLLMPSWEQLLSDSDIDAIIAYLLTLQPWEEEE
ncbi:MAG: c-type cytochrome [Acidobacteriota bacterium]